MREQTLIDDSEQVVEHERLRIITAKFLSLLCEERFRVLLKKIERNRTIADKSTGTKKFLC